jgi:ribose 5-phosphate isomerase B
VKVVVGSDHAGFPGKAGLISYLRALGHEVADVGTDSTEMVDFPDFVQTLTSVVVAGEAERGIFLGGSGIGAAMAANKIGGIRAAVAHDVYSAHQCVEHSDANVLCMGVDVVGPRVLCELVEIFLAARFLPDDQFHRRVDKISLLDRGR